MATNIGIDFGSTYSMFSSYDEIDDTVNGIQAENGSIYVPSVACINKLGRLVTGEEAKRAILRNSSRVPFRAFKMLLHELDHEKVKRYGYLEKNPLEVSSAFLKKYLDIAAQKQGVQQFDSAVICVPEHWTSSCVSMSGRAVLLNICNQFQTNEGKPLLKKLRVVTEPVAATAYYAYNYGKHHKKSFEGKVIVVDYGGGTLDVTLTSVTARTGPNSSSTMEIDTIFRDGVGENHNDGQIGDAGLAYMEEVTKMALAAAGFPDPELDGDFMLLKDELESALMSNTQNISNRIKTKYQLGMKKMAMDQEEFTSTTYGDYDCTITFTYAMLYNAFQKLIRPTLDKYLGRFKKLCDKKGYDTKLAIVGGFGQFPLVQKAVWEIFKCSDTALDIAASAEGGRQDAISFGAALIAAGKISVKISSKYSMGLLRTRKGQMTFRFALRCGEGVDCSKVYPLCNKEDADKAEKPWEPILYTESSDPNLAPWIFAVGDDSEDLTHAIRLTPLPEISRKLATEVRNAAGLYRAEMKEKGYNHVSNAYFFGFSMNESDIYSLHIFPTHPGTRQRDEKPLVTLSLGEFPAIFGPNVSFDPGPRNENLLTYIE